MSSHPRQETIQERGVRRRPGQSDGAQFSDRKMPVVELGAAFRGDCRGQRKSEVVPAHRRSPADLLSRVRGGGGLDWEAAPGRAARHRLAPAMARYGVWQCKEMVFRYCDWGGSSRGMREFLVKGVKQFTEANTQMNVHVEMRHGCEPVIQAKYLSGTTHTVGTRNEDAAFVAKWAHMLRCNTGRSSQAQVSKRVVSSRPSIQGKWTVDTFERTWNVSQPLAEKAVMTRRRPSKQK